MRNHKPPGARGPGPRPPRPGPQVPSPGLIELFLYLRERRKGARCCYARVWCWRRWARGLVLASVGRSVLGVGVLASCWSRTGAVLASVLAAPRRCWRLAGVLSVLASSVLASSAPRRCWLVAGSVGDDIAGSNNKK